MKSLDCIENEQQEINKNNIQKNLSPKERKFIIISKVFSIVEMVAIIVVILTALLNGSLLFVIPSILLIFELFFSFTWIYKVIPNILHNNNKMRKLDIFLSFLHGSLGGGIFFSLAYINYYNNKS